MAKKCDGASLPEKLREPIEFCTVSGKVRVDEHGEITLTGAPAPDGYIYATHIENGCIVGYLTEPIRDVHVMPACATIPNDCCEGSGPGGGATVEVHPAADNVTKLVSGKLYTKIYATGEGCTVTGSGTLDDRLLIRVDSQQQSVNLQGKAPIKVAHDGSGGYTLSFEPRAAYTGEAGGLKITNGLVEDYIDLGVTTISAVNPGVGVTTTTDGGVVTVELAETGAGGKKYDLGTATVTTDKYGRVQEIAPIVGITEDDMQVKVPGAIMVFAQKGVLSKVVREETSVYKIAAILEEESVTINRVLAFGGELSFELIGAGEDAEVVFTQQPVEFTNLPVSRATTRTITIGDTLHGIVQVRPGPVSIVITQGEANSAVFKAEVIL